MTLLGKIFTVLIFIMSLVFMTFSVMVYATHKNWKLVAMNPDPTLTPKYPKLGLKQQVDEGRLFIKQLKQDLQNLQSELAKERAARRQALAVLQTKEAQLSDQLVRKEKELSDEVAAHGVAAQALQSTNESAAKWKEEVDLLRAKLQATEVDRDTQFNSVVKLTDDLHQLQGVYARLTERRDQLVVDVSRYKKQLDARGIKVEDPVESIVPPIRGEITAVSSKDLVEISVGADDGIRPDHQLDVFRNATYLGQIKVLKTSPDKAVAQIIKASQRGPIVKGDKVGSNLITVSSK